MVFIPAHRLSLVVVSEATPYPFWAHGLLIRVVSLVAED